VDRILRTLGLDAYQRAAHWQPAILTIAPFTVTAVVWGAAAAKLLMAAATAVITAPLLVVLMQFGRSRGRAVQRRMVDRLGALPSALALRHGDRHHPSALTERYHAALRRHGFVMPASDEEAAAPAAADDVYRAVVAWLPEQMRDAKKFSLLHSENRSYGFRRNLLGLKPLALAITVLSLAADGVLTYFVRGDEGHLIVGALLGALIASWLGFLTFAVRESFVEDASWAYADRQLAGIEALPVKRPVGRKKAGQASCQHP